MGVIRTLVVDDRQIVRSALRSVLDADGRFEVVAEAADPAAAARGVAIEPPPGLALVDVQLGEHDGIALARRLRELRPDLVIVIVSTMDAADLPTDALDDGADAFIAKSSLTPDRLLEVVRALPGARCLAC